MAIEEDGRIGENTVMLASHFGDKQSSSEGAVRRDIRREPHASEVVQTLVETGDANE